jgi:hypothetical protein
LLDKEDEFEGSLLGLIGHFLVEILLPDFLIESSAGILVKSGFELVFPYFTLNLYRKKVHIPHGLIFQ